MGIENDNITWLKWKKHPRMLASGHFKVRHKELVHEGVGEVVGVVVLPYHAEKAVICLTRFSRKEPKKARNIDAPIQSH